MPNLKLTSSLLCLLGVLFTGAAWALPSDRQATITVDADHAQINEKTGITEYRGTVVIQQGTMLIEADQVTIYSTDGQASKIICTGEPAHYQQQPNLEDGLVNARANTIEYHLDRDVITLIKNASLEQQNSTLRGDHIDYDIQAELVEARGSDNNQQRVHMVIPASAQTSSDQAGSEQTSSKKTSDEQPASQQKDSE